MQTLKERLNSEQYAAATADIGHNLIIASAGTGKTSTIVARIEHLLGIGVRQEDILLLTFTNKAASEMIARLKVLLNADTLRLGAGTFHSTALKYLRQTSSITLKQPRELKTLFKSIYHSYTFPISNTPPYSSGYLFDLVSSYHNTSFHMSFIDFLRSRLVAKKLDEEYLKIYDLLLLEFDRAKEYYGYVGYDDLLLRYKSALLSKESGVSYTEVLCDEYQDTNPLQYSILQAYDTKGLFCVGDYDQSIYAFNGADISIISGFKERFCDAKVFSLGVNYRSSEAILTLANRVIAHNPRIYPKELRVAKKGAFPPPRLLCYPTFYEQGDDIAKRIQVSLTPRSDIAIIFRNNSSADLIEGRLREVGVPTRRKGGLSFFDAREIKACIALLSIVANPRDMMSFISLLSEARGIGESSAKDIYDALIKLGDGSIYKGIYNPNDAEVYVKDNPLLLFNEVSTLDPSRLDHLLKHSFLRGHKVLGHGKIDAQNIGYLEELLSYLGEARAHYDDLARLLRMTISAPVYRSICERIAHFNAVGKDGVLDRAKKADLQARYAKKSALLYELARGYKSLHNYLNAIMLNASEAGNKEGVNLLTVHASKGLEFKEVYIIDLNEGRFPNLKLAKQSGSIEEERRLFYVALTRCKEKLSLSYTQSGSGREALAPSRFLKEAGLLGG